MRIQVKRIAKKAEYTIGHMYIDGKYFCDTLEDRDRGLKKEMGREECLKRKVYGMTAIPTGTYDVTITWSNKYKKKMPQIMNVPAFDGIRIHAGNTHHDTLGCILLGKNREVGKVLDSRVTSNAFFNKLLAAGGKATITIE